MRRPLAAVRPCAALYLNMLVLIVQAFLKVPPLRALVPTGSGPAFLAAEAVTLVVFVAPGFLALRRFYPPRPAPAL
jgi:hypothetical protein